MTEQAVKGDWVQIHQVVLHPGERADNLPQDTKNVPLEMWIKGFINHDGKLNDTVEITTVTGRCVKGELTEINPGYSHGFGKCVPEILHIGLDLKKILWEEKNNE
ncbi:hypothetical protein OXPF_43080 [Oxobacter pfennigii]|uniref:2-amino-4-ketopentanoate thiolase alpha subunit n=1 Tax=Oxobacter pfennigii TaxID=36849 RepID=A0A0P8W4S9_9CLOT|nr:2-amino-4-oxopentanoate thiolase subunit OrtA [Oxobacter pfennigii]KPU42523.1 hypothetical protein OXPF_43080 [Oxobacter pfennigii]